MASGMEPAQQTGLEEAGPGGWAIGRNREEINCRGVFLSRRWRLRGIEEWNFWPSHSSIGIEYQHSMSIIVNHQFRNVQHQNNNEFLPCFSDN
jgi:hypothetical protein